MINKYNFDFKEILDFLNNYVGHEYKNPDKIYTEFIEKV
ncbi:hypothetical protein CLG_B1024 [Clostridium botulinum D str. 1873]|uniref:Uncharacterized protein n=1 Tax=Clostridium botulinum D str. 1873 TaxID=592027 RepID=A0A9P2G7V6_CLOBO|nr:hypothetical protein CLG_B1024 [Clostridium botulinum D str. 1873]